MPPPLRQRIIVDTSGVRRGYKEAADEAKKYGQQSKKAATESGNAFQRLGGLAKRWLAGAVATAALAAATALARGTAAAAKFNAEMAQVGTLTRGRGIRGLSDGVLDLAKRLPVALSDLTRGLYQAVSAGIDAGKAIAFMDTAARAAVGGNATVTQSVAGLTAALNGFQLSADKAEDVADTLFTGVRRGVTTFGELSGQLGSVSGLAKEANVSLEETVAATAALTLTTNDTSKAVTQLRGIIQRVIKPSQQGATVLDELGLSFDAATIREKGFRQALGDVVSGLNAAGVSLGTVFDDAEGLTGALTLAGSQSESFASILSDMETKQGASAEAFREMRDEATSLWDRVKNRLNVALIELGRSVLPAATSAMKAFLSLTGTSSQEVAESVSDLRREIRGLDDAEGAARVVDELRGKQNLTEQQSRDLADAIETLNDTFPFYVSQMNDAGEATDFLTDAIRRQIEAQRQLNYAQQAEGIADLVARLRQARTAQANLLRITEDIANRQLPEQHRQLETGNPLADETLRAPGRIKSLEDDMRRYGIQARQAAQESKNLVLQLGPLFENAPDTRSLFRDMIDQGVVRNMAEAASFFTDITTQYRLLTTGLGDLTGSAGGANTPATEEVAQSLAARIESLTAQRDALVDQGERTAELVRVNRELADAEKLRDRLLQAGVEKLGDERASLERHLELQRKINEARRHYLARVNPRGIDPGSDGSGVRPLVPGTITVSPDTGTKGVTGSLRALRIGAETQKDLDEFNKNLRRGKKNADDLSKSLRNVATAGRSLLNVAEVFGSISDEARQAAQGALDVVDNISALQSLGPGASALDMAVPYAGIAAGVLSLVAPLFSGNDSQVDAIKENTRRIEQAIKELSQQIREGEGLSSNQGRAIRNAFVEARYATAQQEAGGNISTVQGAYEDLFKLLDQAGTDTGGFRGQLSALFARLGGIGPDISEDPITGDLIENWDRWVQRFNEGIDAIDTDILSIVDQLDEPGLFKQNVGGVLGQAAFQSAFGAITGSQAFGQVVSGLQALSDTDLGALGGYLNQLAALDPNAQQEEINALIAEIASLSAGGASFGDLTPSDVQDILGALQGYLGGDAGALAGQSTLVQQVQQQITTFQANEIVALLEEIAYQLKAIFAEIATPIKQGPVTLFTGGGTSVSIGDVSMGIKDSDIPFILRAIEGELRLRMV